MHFQLNVTLAELPGLDRHEINRLRRLAPGAFAPRTRVGRLAVAAREPGGVPVRLSPGLADGLSLVTPATAGAAVPRGTRRARRALHRRLSGAAPPSGLARGAAGAVPAGDGTP